MNPLFNHYAPGAGTAPPFLAGRDDIITDAKLSVERNQRGKSARSFMFTGLRGVGKTVLRLLLNAKNVRSFIVSSGFGLPIA